MAPLPLAASMPPTKESDMQSRQQEAGGINCCTDDLVCLSPFRFLAPEPHHPEEGLWDVSSESTIACPQKSSWYDPWEVAGEEDCLFLNVYRPENHQQDSLPVMVWIHGGALLAGAGTFQEHGPQHLLDKYGERNFDISYFAGR